MSGLKLEIPPLEPSEAGPVARRVLDAVEAFFEVPVEVAKVTASKHHPKTRGMTL